MLQANKSSVDLPIEKTDNHFGGLYIFLSTSLRVPTSTGKPGKSQKKVPCMEKSWNWKKTEKSWKNHGIL